MEKGKFGKLKLIALVQNIGGQAVKESLFAGGISQIGCTDMVRLLPRGEILFELS